MRNKIQSLRVLLESLPGISGIKALKTTLCVWRAFKEKGEQGITPPPPTAIISFGPDGAFDWHALPTLYEVTVIPWDGEEKAKTQIWMYFLPHLGFQ